MQISRETSKIDYWFEKSNFDKLFSTQVKTIAEIHTFLAKESLSKEGDSFPYLYYLVSGKAKIYMTHLNGRRSLVHFATASCFIGEMGLLEVEAYSKGIEAMVPCVCIALPLHQCKKQLLADTEFLKNLSITLALKAVYRSENLAKTYAYPFENRLASFILLTEQNGRYVEKHTEASEYLNVSYRHLLYTLQVFVSIGMLEKDGRSYLIKNRGGLETIAI
jgi:CRP-like cAMP-binding protein